MGNSEARLNKRQVFETMEKLEGHTKALEKILNIGYYDAIVTNPPYMKKDSGLQNENNTKLISRHEVECTLEDVIEKSSKLLKDLGEFYMVHRAERLVDIMCLLRKYKLEPKNIRFVHSKADDKPSLILVRAVRTAKDFLKIDKPLVIYRDDGEYTDEILKIYDKKR